MRESPRCYVQISGGSSSNERKSGNSHSSATRFLVFRSETGSVRLLHRPIAACDTKRPRRFLFVDATDAGR